MRDTFADTTAAARDLGFRSRVPLAEGLAREWEWLRAARGEEARRPSCRGRARRPLAHHVDLGALRAPPTRSSGTRRRRRCEEGVGPGAPEPQAPGRRLPAERAPARRAHRSRPTPTSTKAAPRTTCSPCRRIASSSRSTRSTPRSDYAAVPGGRVLLQAEEQPGPRPDRDAAGARGVPAAARRLPGVEVPRPDARPDPRVPPDARALAPSGGLLLPARAPGLALGDRPLRDDRQRLPGLRQVRRGALSPGRMPGSSRALRRGPAVPGTAREGVPAEPLRGRRRDAPGELPPVLDPRSAAAGSRPGQARATGDKPPTGDKPAARTPPADGSVAVDPPKAAPPVTPPPSH